MYRSNVLLHNLLCTQSFICLIFLWKTLHKFCFHYEFYDTTPLSKPRILPFLFFFHPASSLINFDMVETGTTYSQTTGSQSTLNQISSMSSYGSSKTGRRKSMMNRRGSKFAGIRISSSTEIDIQKVWETFWCVILTLVRTYFTITVLNA